MRDEHIPFLDDIFERGMRNYYGMTGERDLSNIWRNVRVIDGTTEYIAMDLVVAQVFRHLQMTGRIYETEADEDMPDYPTIHYELTWRHSENHTTAMTLPNANFWKHTPHILNSFEAAIQTLNLKRARVTVTSNLDDTLLVMWIADVNGYKAGGNCAAEAVTHAWGISIGLWTEDELIAV